MLCCPVCKNKLVLCGKTYRCENNHCFDLSKKGYVNLLLSQASNKKIHGDDKTMALSRRDFLNSGHYSFLLNSICSELDNCRSVLDVGCGECYYTSGIKEYLGKDAKVAGVDISKNIIEVGSSRVRGSDIVLAVAGCTKLPFANSSLDALVSVFAPVCESEFYRVLKPDGKVVRVSAGVDHLIELKKSIYDRPFLNPEAELKMHGFYTESHQRLMYKFTAQNQELKNLFTMTPYYYKTSKSDAQKLDLIPSLEITADFSIDVYKKCL